MNEKIRKTLVDQAGYWPNVEFADFTPEMGNINFYRWPETQYSDAPDPVHLSEMGVQERIMNHPRYTTWPDPKTEPIYEEEP